MVALNLRTAAPPKKKTGFRPDIQGLRAIAVGVVLIYHAGMPWMPGGFVGVDVFFVISGFLITGLLLKEAQQNGQISVKGFYVRRAKRILPAALVVLAFTMIATLVVLPPTRWASIAWETVGAAFSVVNWQLAASTTNYLNGDSAASPLQHFWSLGVEEQFYIFWPLLLIGALFFARPDWKGRQRRKQRSSHPILPSPQRLTKYAALGLAIVTVPSFAYSIYLTEVNPGASYFVTTTRVWELAVGAFLAIYADRLVRIGTGLKVVLGWAGLAGIVLAAVTFNSTTPFPSYTALLPTVASAFIIVSGMGLKEPTGVGRLLSARPMVWVGDISYSLYLWHWPLIVLVTYLLGGLSTVAGIVTVIVSFIPAYLSYRYVETPIHQPKTHEARYGVVLQNGALAILATAAVPLLVLAFVVPRANPVDTAVAAAPESVEEFFGTSDAEAAPRGAALLVKDAALGTPVDDPGTFTPTPVSAAEDNPSLYAEGCHTEFEETEVKNCTYGDPNSDYVVALVGDSHAASWAPALQTIAKNEGWRLETYTKSSCPLADVLVYANPLSKPYEDCLTWNENLQEHFAESTPDVVISSSIFYQPVVDGVAVEDMGQRTSVFADGVRRSWESLTDNGASVVALTDTPAMEIDIPECASANPKRMTECSAPREDALKLSGIFEPVASDGLKSVDVVDLNDMICPEESCPAVIGGVLIYRDAAHLTATYSRSLAEPLSQELNEILG